MHRPAGVVADDGDGPAGVAAAGDDFVDIRRGPGGGYRCEFQVGHLGLDPGGQVGADGGRVGEDLRPSKSHGTLMARKIDNCLTVIEASSRDRSLTWDCLVERVTRIELALSAWEAERLRLLG